MYGGHKVDLRLIEWLNPILNPVNPVKMVCTGSFSSNRLLLICEICDIGGWHHYFNLFFNALILCSDWFILSRSIFPSRIKRLMIRTV